MQLNQVALPMYDTFDAMQYTAEVDGVLEYALPNGDYPAVVVMGDPSSKQMVNNITIESTIETDPDPYNPNDTGGYKLGDFDGYAVIAHITDGKLTIAPGTACF